MAPPATELILLVRKIKDTEENNFDRFVARSGEQRGGLRKHGQAGDLHPRVALAGLDPGEGGGGALQRPGHAH